ncbi:MAG: c-type cytochrome [Paracoccaceae bacterium]
MRKLLTFVIALGVIAGAAGLAQSPIASGIGAGRGPAEAGRGEQLFWAGGCVSCHAAPGAEGEDKLILAGGMRLESPFGTFVSPNISSDPTHGIGAWSVDDLANAMLRGVSPEGAHYYPSFPYTSYARMSVQDIADLKAYLDTLPASDTPSAPHEMGFPFTIRRGIGLWKLLNLDPDWVMADPGDAVLERGRFLVEGPGHCSECHTPRDGFGGLDTANWMAGGPNPSGPGRIPSLLPDALTWSATDIAYYLESGFTPDFDSAGGHMASVVSNMEKLPAADREAIAAYIKALPVN